MSCAIPLKQNIVELYFFKLASALFRSSGRAGLTGSIIAKKMPSAQELQRLDLSRELEALETGRA